MSRIRKTELLCPFDLILVILTVISHMTCRKNHARAMESMSASLEAEQKAKGEALRVKKALEGEINELEIGLDHANKVRFSTSMSAQI